MDVNVRFELEFHSFTMSDLFACHFCYSKKNCEIRIRLFEK